MPEVTNPKDRASFQAWVQMLDWSIKLFRIAGIRLEIHFTFFIVLIYGALEGWSIAHIPGVIAGIVFVSGVFVCVILHELGHSLTAMRFGIGVQRILLLPIGGMAQFDSIPREPLRELAITAAGPAVNFLIVALAMPFLGFPGLDWLQTFPPLGFVPVIRAIVFVNLVMGLFNLVPVFPMDGGRVFRAGLAFWLPYLKATRWAANIGRLLALAAIAVALFVLEPRAWQVAALFAFIFFGAGAEYRMVAQNERYSGQTVGTFTSARFGTISAEATIRQLGRMPVSVAGEAVLVIGAHDAVIGVVPTGRILDLLRENPGDTLVGHVCESPVTSLQADWPLDPHFLQIISGQTRYFPVYEGNRLAGIFDARQVLEPVTRKSWFSRVKTVARKKRKA